MTLNDFMRTAYKDGGRGEIENGVPVHDCWSLSITIRHYVYGLPMLPSWSFVRAMDKRHLTRAWAEQRAALVECEPKVGALAAVYRSDLCLHIAVVVEVDGALAIVETVQTGPRWMRIPEFERRYNKVRYYYDRDISIEA